MWLCSIHSNHFEMSNWLRIATALCSASLMQARHVLTCTRTIYTGCPIFWYESFPIEHVFPLEFVTNSFCHLVHFHSDAIEAAVAQACYFARCLPVVSSGLSHSKDSCHFERSRLHHHQRCAMWSARRCIEGKWMPLNRIQKKLNIHSKTLFSYNNNRNW